jgi:hypothetical protein
MKSILPGALYVKGTFRHSTNNTSVAYCLNTKREVTSEHFNSM